MDVLLPDYTASHSRRSFYSWASWRRFFSII